MHRVFNTRYTDGDGLMGSNQKGSRAERDLVNRLDSAGFAVMRAPASGSATDRELPDVLAGDGSVFYAIEAKVSSGDPIYIANEEIDALHYFSQNFGAWPRVGVRFDAKHGDPHYGNDDDSGWRFFNPHILHQTGKNYRVKKEAAYSKGARLSSLTGTGGDS